MKDLLKKFIPDFLINWYHFKLAFLAAVLYGFPSRKIKVIGVTGTDGKSTTVHLIDQVLEMAGHKTAFISSVNFKIGSVVKPNNLKMTMPGRFFIQKFLSRAVEKGCQYAVLEVSSEGIKQHRHKFIDFEAAVFTNLSPEHIERHGSFENYKKAKGKLFQAVKNIHVINLDDKNADYFWQFPAKKKYAYGLAKGDINNRDLQLKLQLIGGFNIYNALAAIGVGLSQGVSLDICQKAVESAKGIPGRMELVKSEPFKVIVDYAITPNALEKAYQAVKPTICVLGACGGGRDKWKRQISGQLAQKYCQEIIITNEDPYDEDPTAIIEQVAEGAGPKARKILDRREAIKQALKLAKAGDIVIITGKGSEPWMMLEKGKKIPWDDRKIVKEAGN